MATITPSKIYPSNAPCKRCGGVERYLSDSRCVSCRREYLKQRSQSPEGKAILKKYWQSKKGKAKRKEYEQSEKRKQYLAEWSKSEQAQKTRRYSHVKRTYNLTKEEYDAMLTTQNQKCAICLSNLDRPYVDHDHKCCNDEVSCGKCIRGILCFDCNMLLSKCKEDSKILKSAIQYLITYIRHHPQTDR